MVATDRAGPVREVSTVVNGLTMHYRVSGDGPLVVLLHGWPQTSYCWRLVQPELAAAGYTVIAPDLRGYGRTDKPSTGYDKRTMAQDIHALVARFTSEPVRLVGHDRGGRVAHRYALDHADEVSHLAVLDIAPTLAMFRGGDITTARGYWHWLFHLQPDLPELLVTPLVDGYVRYFLEHWTVHRQPVFDAISHYVDAFRQPGALRASLDDYRATDQDVSDDHASAQAGQKLAMPVLVLWGDRGLPSHLAVTDIWAEFASDVRGAVIDECGHFLPEEQPRAVIDLLLHFLS